MSQTLMSFPKWLLSYMPKNDWCVCDSMLGEGVEASLDMFYIYFLI